MNLPESLRADARDFDYMGSPGYAMRAREAADTIEAADAACARRGCAPIPEREPEPEYQCGCGARAGQEHHLRCINRPDCCCGREGCRTTPRLQALEVAVRELECRAFPAVTVDGPREPCGDVLTPHLREQVDALKAGTDDRAKVKAAAETASRCADELRAEARVLRGAARISRPRSAPPSQDAWPHRHNRSRWP